MITKKIWNTLNVVEERRRQQLQDKVLDEIGKFQQKLERFPDYDAERDKDQEEVIKDIRSYVKDPKKEHPAERIIREQLSLLMDEK